MEVVGSEGLKWCLLYPQSSLTAGISVRLPGGLTGPMMTETVMFTSLVIWDYATLTAQESTSTAAQDFLSHSATIKREMHIQGRAFPRELNTNDVKACQTYLIVIRFNLD